MCGINIPEGKLFKHRRTAHCFKNTEMRLIQRDVDFESRCEEMEFILTGKEGEETV